MPTSTRFAAPSGGENATYPNSPRQPHRPGPFVDGLADGEVRAAPAALPPGMRTAVMLRHRLDLSVGETAELLNCSEGTVKSQTAKAAARLRDLLSHAAVEGSTRDDLKDLVELALTGG